MWVYIKPPPCSLTLMLLLVFYQQHSSSSLYLLPENIQFKLLVFALQDNILLCCTSICFNMRFYRMYWKESAHISEIQVANVCKHNVTAAVLSKCITGRVRGETRVFLPVWSGSLVTTDLLLCVCMCSCTVLI